MGLYVDRCGAGNSHMGPGGSGHPREHIQQGFVNMPVVALVALTAKSALGIQADQGNGHRTDINPDDGSVIRHMHNHLMAMVGQENAFLFYFFHLLQDGVNLGFTHALGKGGA